jgi:hypothetical protein
MPYVFLTVDAGEDDEGGYLVVHMQSSIMQKAPLQYVLETALARADVLSEDASESPE